MRAFLDDVGAVYFNGGKSPDVTLGGDDWTFARQIQAGERFTLSFIACSTNGPSLALDIDAFIDRHGLEVDYDATFHRNLER